MFSGFAAAVVVASAISGCGGDDGGDQSSQARRGSIEAANGSRSTPPTTHLLRPTLQCLERRRLSVDMRLPADPRLRALRDLAQKTSVVVQVGQARLGLAVASGVGEAELLVELLRAPGPYGILRRRNAVVVYRQGQRSEAVELTRCLRPASDQSR